MWQLLSRRWQVLILVGLTAILLLGIQGASEFWTGTRPSLLKLVSLSAMVIGTVLVAIANFIWRWLWQQLPFLNRIFFPDLNGIWEGTLKSTWIDPQTGQSPAPIPTKITIKQSILTISIKQKTAESTSWSNLVIPEAHPEADRYRLWYSYSNQPKREVSHRSEQHDGIAWLEISLDEKADDLEGQYFTSRRTSGDITVRRV
jgi:hypothetical protein